MCASRAGVDSACMAFRRGEVIDPPPSEGGPWRRMLAAAQAIAETLAVAAFWRVATGRPERGSLS